MSFLTAKAEPSHLNNTLHHDRTLATGSQYTPAEQSSSSASFRSSSNNASSFSHDHNQTFDSFTRVPSSHTMPHALPSGVASQALFNPPQDLLLAASSPLDGSEVLALLNESSGVYDEEVHGDDLVAGSMSYRSHQHQSDHQHSLAEFENLRQRQMEEWILTDDIIAYIEKQDSSYVDDVYGLPPVIASLVKEAKEELKAGGAAAEGQQKAIGRLQMIRDHLIGRSQGNRTMAVQQGLQMKESDWATLF